MWRTGGISWLTDDDRNMDVVLARILEPLLLTSTEQLERRQLDDLRVMGMFEKEHETALYEWMFKT
jgi:hypothetical protein